MSAILVLKANSFGFVRWNFTVTMSEERECNMVLTSDLNLSLDCSSQKVGLFSVYLLEYPFGLLSELSFLPFS